MATEMGGNCVICQDTWDDVASTLPCGHHFCQGCILQWAQINPVCPLCRRPIETVRFSDDAEREIMIQSLQGILEEHTESLVQSTIDTIVRHCRSGAQRLLHSHAAADDDDDDSPAASSSSSSYRSSSSSSISSSSSPNNRSSSSSSSQMGTPASSSPAVSMMKEEGATGEATQPRSHSHTPRVTMPAGQDWPQEEPVHAVVMLAGSSSQSSRPRCPCPRRCPKRRARDPQDFPPIC
ncbi:hypothetical protein HGM15179_017171 [Zosterops borbonicus]|uniref:RING-type domain-containing protein n=1 Tax=Zosterops borbonicus TaxID=364589 RepID=A0A8K1G1C6_9PASS|nr:hypothetical protein HGM15179_017171 [Zosterops borbonicus]